MQNISIPKLDIFFAVGIIILVIFLIYTNRKSNPKNNETSSRLEIQQLIEKVKSELVANEKKQIEENKTPLFELKDFELEVNFVVKESTNQKGSFDFDVVTVGTENEFGSEKTQKIKLRLTPIAPKKEEIPALNKSIEVLTEPPPEKKVQGEK